MALITVIVPVYNVEPFLHRCVDSILNQSFTDFELVLVDDGSTDNCPIICEKYAKQDLRVHVIHQENGASLLPEMLVLSGHFPILTANGSVLLTVTIGSICKCWKNL